MRKEGVITLVLVTMGLALAALYLVVPSVRAGGLNFGDRPGVKYVSCYDAGNCTFNLPGQDPLVGWEIPVRLRGMAAPEIRGNCQAENERALQARDVARATLEKANVIILRNVARDKTFGLTAEVEVDGQDLGTLLVESALVSPWSGEGAKPSFCPDEPVKPQSGQPEPAPSVQGGPN